MCLGFPAAFLRAGGHRETIDGRSTHWRDNRQQTATVREPRQAAACLREFEAKLNASSMEQRDGYSMKS